MKWFVTPLVYFLMQNDITHLKRDKNYANKNEYRTFTEKLFSRGKHPEFFYQENYLKWEVCLKSDITLQMPILPLLAGKTWASYLTF